MRVKKQRVKTAKGRKISSTNWIHRQINDPYVQKARKEGYRSRAAYKLIEINDKYRLIKPNHNIIDLGAAPGGWSQILAEITKSGNGHNIALDLKEIDHIKGIEFIQGDFTTPETLQKLDEILDGKKLNLILSDMAPSSSGIPGVDHDRIMIMCESVFIFACKTLKQGGTVLVKVLQGGTENNLLSKIKRLFRVVKHVKPAASRKDSAEMYLLAMEYNGKDIIDN